MEQLGLPPATMRTRVEETLDLLGIADLRDRALRTLSGGQQQRVAIAAVLAAGPRVLVLDEPTSALDPTSAEEVVAAVVRLVHDLGVTVVMAEHRLERVLQYADRLVLVAGDGTVVDGDPGRADGRRADRSAAGRAGRAWPAGRRCRCPSGTRAGGRRRAAGSADRPPAAVPGRRRRPDRPRRQPISPSATATVAAVRGVDADAAPGRTRRADGPQRVRQVQPALGADRPRPPHRRIGGAAGRSRWTAESPIALVPQTAADLLYLATVGRGVSTPPTAGRPPPTAPAAGCSTGWPRASPTTRTRETCRRVNGWRSRSRSS